MDLLDIFASEQALSAQLDLFGARRERPFDKLRFHIFFDQLFRKVRIHIPRERYDDVRGIVALGDVCAKILAREAAHVVARPEDRAAVAGRPVIGLGEHVQAQIVRRVLHHRDLFQDDPLFPVHLRFGEGRMQDEIGKDLERFFEMFGCRFCIIAGRVFGGESVGLRPDAIHRVGDLKRVSFRRPLEHHVFDKMGDAVFLFRFEAGAGAAESVAALSDAIVWSGFFVGMIHRCLPAFAWSRMRRASAIIIS